MCGGIERGLGQMIFIYCTVGNREAACRPRECCALGEYRDLCSAV